MRIVFADPTLAYTVATAYEQPLGGCQSAICHVSDALAAAGHEVLLLTATESPAIERGVICKGWDLTSQRELREFRADVVVSSPSAKYAEDLRHIFGGDPRLILWTGHAHDQPSVQPLLDPAQRMLYDGYSFVSEWQSRNFSEKFSLDPARVKVIGYAASPAFLKLFAAGDDIGPAKDRPPVLAYTSTPFRGLHILLAVFPEIRRRVPGIRLKVYSSMRVYQVSDARDESEFGALYRQCAETEGVEYIGSLPQPQLARELRRVTALAYPNTFPETYCISALEAMAAGCSVVSSELGALPETTAGYARLVPIINRKDTYAGEFIDATVDALNESASGTDAALLAAQVAYVNSACTWQIRAQAWLAWLESLPRKR